MKAILIKSFGEAEQLYLGKAPTPSPLPHEILVKVQATALNRADTLQRRGYYPPPQGASEILGLEIAGIVAEVGSAVTKWKAGDEVFGLLPGGGYAEYAAIHEDMAIEKPGYLSFQEAAALPEVFLTAFQALKWLGKLQPQESILIHAAASGVGTAAIQLAKAMQAAHIFATASATKHEVCKNLGADTVIDYKSQRFEDIIQANTNAKGVHLIIDFIGAPYFNRNLDSLALDGKLVMLAMLGGMNRAEVDFGKILSKRLQVLGSTLRARNQAYQIALTKDFWAYTSPLFAEKKLRPVIDSVMDWQDVVAAHQRMEANQNTGKIVLTL